MTGLRKGCLCYFVFSITAMLKFISTNKIIGSSVLTAFLNVSNQSDIVGLVIQTGEAFILKCLFKLA